METIISDENPFNILNKDIGEVREIDPQKVEGELEERIKTLVNASDIVLFMKGNADFPQCGFSANTVAILKHLGKNFDTFDILQDMEIRQGLKEYSNWPTFPQLYYKGQLLGGNDIITEMYETGELKEVLK